jgi:hypothetical protein
MDWHSEDLCLADVADYPYKSLGMATSAEQRRKDGDVANGDKAVGDGTPEVSPFDLGGTRGSRDDS